MLHAQMMGNQPVIDHPARFQIIRYEGHTNRATVIAPPVVINPVIKVVVPSAETITFSVVLRVTLPTRRPISRTRTTLRFRVPEFPGEQGGDLASPGRIQRCPPTKPVTRLYPAGRILTTSMIMPQIKSPHPIFGRPQLETRTVFKNGGFVQQHFRIPERIDDSCFPGSQMIANCVVLIHLWGSLSPAHPQDDSIIFIQTLRLAAMPTGCINTSPLSHMYQADICFGIR